MANRPFFSFLFIFFLALCTTPLIQGCLTVAATGAAVAGAMIASDRRTTGAYIDDQVIESKASSRIGKMTWASQGHINIVSYNRYVLVVGQVPTEEARREAIDVVRRVENVRGVYNELIVGPNSAIFIRSNDSTITGNVKQRMTGGRNVSSGDIKVVTEAGIVYLMGLVTRAEGEAAAEVASTTKDVIKVVRLFEYLSEDEAYTIDVRQSQQNR
jgi:osmotically-inducible protein OsmY